LLLPGIDYFQVVFTMPDTLSSLTLGNRREMFNLLFRSAWRALKRVIEDEQQFEAAAGMVLHTWKQTLESHVHVHAFVPGGGPSLTTPGTWKTARPPVHLRQDRPWLVDADELRVAFRTEFLQGLRSLHRRGRLKLTGDWIHLRDAAAFAAWLKPLEAISWVTYIQPPPTADSSPENVLKYLARYLTGGPISDRRLVSHEDGRVTFWARKGTTQGGSDELAEVELSGAEFVRRWSLHILPKGFTKTRRFGSFINHHAQRYLAACRELVPSTGTSAVPPPDHEPTQPTGQRCPHCDGEMLWVAGDDSPGWHVVMSSAARPGWYDDG
jgi:hypothetical protein